jgi:predicted nicotinamide N-methyase
VTGTEFVRGATRLAVPPFLPELRLWQADEAFELWQRTEEARGETGLPPPFWAFPWAGGQALARYVLDHPDLVAGRRVLDLAAGSGLVAVAAAKAGAARVRAADVDPLAMAAITLNASANGVAVTPVRHDLLDGPADADVVLAGDVCYERAFADRAVRFLRRAATSGAAVLLGDPGRAYLPSDGLDLVATYQVPVIRALEDADVKRTAVWTLS